MKEINKKIINFDKAAKRANIFMYLAMALVFISLFGGLASALYIAKNTNDNIYVMDGEGDINPAYKSHTINDLEAEADNHLKMFYDSFFSYDMVNVDKNVAKGIELGGKSVKDLWKTYKQNNWYNQIKQNNIIVKSTVDSTFFDFSKKPYRARVFGHQELHSGDYKEIRTLNLDCNLIVVSRVKNRNPHGLSIENIIITSNEKIN